MNIRLFSRDLIKKTISIVPCKGHFRIRVPFLSYFQTIIAWKMISIAIQIFVMPKKYDDKDKIIEV